jgi:FAD:protein FMN transferase
VNDDRPAPSVVAWRAWGTSVAVCTPTADSLGAARRAVQAEMRSFDDAVNRFRTDSDLSRFNRAAGVWVRVTPLLLETIGLSLDAAAETGGAVDPTVGRPLLALGYDRDLDELDGCDPAAVFDERPRPAPGWRCVDVDWERSAARLPRGTRIDFGAVAKALCVDRAAARAAAEAGSGVAVSIGGDVAVAGVPPDGGWLIGVTESTRTPHPDHDCVVSMRSGGVATSGTTARTWRRAGHTLHHIVDPRTGWPAPATWRSVTVAAPSCVTANTASTAAVVWGDDAPFELAQRGLAARLVAADGEVIEVGAWPRSSGAATC